MPELSKVNLLQAVEQTELFEYAKVGEVDGRALHVLQVENRTLDFHTHESDELFYVLEGQFVLETDDAAIALQTGEMLIVPRGVCHRPVVTTRVKCLLVLGNDMSNAEKTGGNHANS